MPIHPQGRSVSHRTSAIVQFYTTLKIKLMGKLSADHANVRMAAPEQHLNSVTMTVHYVGGIQPDGGLQMGTTRVSPKC